MRLFIRLKNGQPFEHPLFEDNLRMAFPDVDPDNPGPNFAPFIRVLAPAIGPYDNPPVVSYQWVGDTVQDVWHIEPMSAEDKQKKIQSVIAANPPSWTFDEETCSCTPPVPYPTDGMRYRWDEDTLSWVVVSS